MSGTKHVSPTGELESSLKGLGPPKQVMVGGCGVHKCCVDETSNYLLSDERNSAGIHIQCARTRVWLCVSMCVYVCDRFVSSSVNCFYPSCSDRPFVPPRTA
jgi:hypothetical protein